MDDEKSLSDEATFAGQRDARPRRAEMSLGDARTLGGSNAVGNDTVIDDIEVVDLEARYKIEGTLGQGGMGAVLLATDTRLDRKVAIKRILGEAAGNRMAVQRFLTEAKAIAALNHPNIVQIYDYGWAKDGPFLIMEYVDGGSLLDLCKQGAMALDKAVDLVCQVCDGLGMAHEQGIVHRDIKPANILINKGGLPKLTDFGLAKAEANDHGMTMTGAVMGTPDFMPPEQRRDAAEVDHRGDLWSLAATIYQMTTGRSPKVIRLHELPQELQSCLSKALEDDKNARYQSAKEFREALKGISGGTRKLTGPAQAEGDLQEGQCKACGTITSDLTKNFCRNPRCGTSLRVGCLKCDAQIPVWDGVCGRCGGNQPVLLEARRTALAASRAEAESLLHALAFDEAIARAGQLSCEPHPDLCDFVEWGKAFVASTTAEKNRQQAVASTRLQEAKTHIAAWDYSAAIQLLESIAEPLRAAEVSALLVDCRAKQQESVSLLATIADRIRSKDLEGLVPLVERAATLRGDRKDLEKLRVQLAERSVSRLTRARAAIATGDARSAANAFARAVAEDYSPEDQKFIANVRRAVEIEDEIVRLVKEAKADSTITPDEATAIQKAGNDYLAFNPNSEKIRALVTQADRILGKGSVDIVFVIDVTGSMQRVIDDLAENISAFLDSLVHPPDANDAPSVRDWRAKVFGYRDVIDTRAAEAFVDNPFVRDAAALRSQLKALEAKGGGDEPESALDALFKVATMGATDRAAPEDAKKWRYRSATRVAILFTDASCHPTMWIPEAKGGKMTDLFNVLMSNRIILSIFAPDMPCWHDLSQVQRSEYMPIAYDKSRRDGAVVALKEFTHQAHFRDTLKQLAASVAKKVATPEL